MLTWIAALIQLRSATLLKQPMAVAHSWAEAIGAAFAARFGAHTRLFEARSQFCLQALGDTLGVVPVSYALTRQRLAFQERGVQARIGQLAPYRMKFNRVAPPRGSTICSGVKCRT